MTRKGIRGAVMRMGMIGLGRMGMNMVKRLLEGGHQVVAYARTQATVDEARRSGAEGVSSLEDLAAKLTAPRVVWLMVPSGKPVDDLLGMLRDLLKAGDIVIDGGNSYYKDSMRRAEMARSWGMHYLDAGTSGGIWGLQVGYCLMVGGEEAIYRKLEPLFQTLAPPGGYGHMGPSGSGHFVKMVHNGIEYGMLQAYGEGFEIMNASGFNLDFAKISRLWNQGSVVRSWLLELAEKAFAKDPELASLEPYVEDSGEGRWTVAEAVEKNVSAPVITLALLERLRSREKACFSAKVIAALRNEFGGHAVRNAAV